MREYITSAIVLAIQENRGSDRVADLFTRDLGRIRTRVPGGSKILSKFSPHLSVLNTVIVRLARKYSFTITDAVRCGDRPSCFDDIRRLGSVLNLALLLRTLLPIGEPDLSLWHYTNRALRGGPTSLIPVLMIAGYDSRSAKCEICNSVPARAFLLSEHSFLCSRCRVHARESDVLLVN